MLRKLREKAFMLHVDKTCSTARLQTASRKLRLNWSTVNSGGLQYSRYGLYVLCFLALNYIEFLRSTQAGDIWKTAANCTGLVVMVIVFSQLPVRRFLRPAAFFYTALCITAMWAIYRHWLQHIGEYSLGQVLTAVMNVWWLGLAVPYFFHRIIIAKNLKLRIGALGAVWIAFTLWTLVSAAGRWWPVWYLFMFGCFYLIRFSREDRSALVRAMIDGTIASFFVIQSYAYLFRPYDEVRYKGAFANCNMTALYYLIVYCMILFKLHLLHIEKGKWGWKLFYLTGAGGMLAFQFMTICRTSWLVSLFVTLCYGWAVVRRGWGEGFGKLALRGCALLVSAAVTFPAVFLTIRWLPTIHPHPIWYEGEWSEDRVASWDPPDSEKFVEMDELLEEALGRILNIKNLFQSKNPFLLRVYAYNEADIAEADIVPEPDYDWRSNSMSIRIEFFKTYLRNSTWLGHPERDGHYVYEESGVYIWHGQNLWIQILYYFGYPAGALLAVLILLAGWKVWRKSRTIREDAFALIPIVICVAYLGYGITEVVWNPGQLIFTLVFLVMHPQLTESVAMG